MLVRKQSSVIGPFSATKYNKYTNDLTRARLLSADSIENSNSVQLEDMTDSAMSEEHLLFDGGEAKKQFNDQAISEIKVSPMNDAV